MQKFSHDLITNRAAHVIRAKNFAWYSCHFRVKFARNFFACGVEFFNIFSKMYYLHEISSSKNMNLMRKIYRIKFTSKYLRVKMTPKNVTWNSCLFFMSKWHEKNFTWNSYVIRVIMIRKNLRMQFMRFTFSCIT